MEKSCFFSSLAGHVTYILKRLIYQNQNNDQEHGHYCINIDSYNLSASSGSSDKETYLVYNLSVYTFVEFTISSHKIGLNSPNHIRLMKLIFEK